MQSLFATSWVRIVWTYWGSVTKEHILTTFWMELKKLWWKMLNWLKWTFLQSVSGAVKSRSSTFLPSTLYKVIWAKNSNCWPIPCNTQKLSIFWNNYNYIVSWLIPSHSSKEKHSGTSSSQVKICHWMWAITLEMKPASNFYKNWSQMIIFTSRSSWNSASSSISTTSLKNYPEYRQLSTNTKMKW